MKKITLIFLFFLSTNVFANNFTIGQNLFLNACGSDPQNYKTQPLNLENKILEVPNKVISIETSPYDRPIITKAISRIVLPNGENLTATLHNFRNLTIVDGSGKKLHERKVSGATSIYEYLHNGKVIGWGVGWHKDCMEEYYDDTDFTVLRTYVPYLSNNKIQLHESILKPNISKYFGAYKDSTYPIFSTAYTIPGYSMSLNCYYCGVDFLLIDNNQGVIEIDKITELNQYNININNIAPLMAVNWIGRSKINPQNSFEEKITLYKSFISTNYEAIIKNAINDYYESKSKHGLDFDLGISKEMLNRINTDKKVIAFRSNIFLLFNDDIPDETIFKFRNTAGGEWDYTTKHEAREDFYEHKDEENFLKFFERLDIRPKDQTDYYTPPTVLSKNELESIYNNLPEWAQPLFLDIDFYLDYTDLDTFEEILQYYNKFCKLKESQIMQIIAGTCFPKYDAFFYDVW